VVRDLDRLTLKRATHRSWQSVKRKVRGRSTKLRGSVGGPLAPPPATRKHQLTRLMNLGKPEADRKIPFV